MPVVDTSPPFVFGGTPSPTPTTTPTPSPTTTPTTTPSPTPTTTPTPSPVTPVIPITPSEFVSRHTIFINAVNLTGSCFHKEDIIRIGFTDQEFYDHSQISIVDKYLVESNGLYCSMGGVTKLAEALKRIGDK